MMEKNDTFKQRKISDLFQRVDKPPPMGSSSTNGERECSDSEQVDNPSSPSLVDIEDMSRTPVSRPRGPVVTTSKRKREPSPPPLAKTWQEALGPPPSPDNFKEWVAYHQAKWKWQKQRRLAERNNLMEKRIRTADPSAPVSNSGLGNFLQRTQRSLLDSPWQILQLAETSEPGTLRCWVLVGSELHNVRVVVPKVFYVNHITPRPAADDTSLYTKCVKVLPRARPPLHLYQFTVSESLYKQHSQALLADLASPDVEGIYETQVTPCLRAILSLGNVCGVLRQEAKRLLFAGLRDLTCYSLEQLESYPAKTSEYLIDIKSSLRYIYLYQHKSQTGTKAVYGLFLTPSSKALVIVLDTVRTNKMPNLSSLYHTERTSKLARGKEPETLPPDEITFEVHFETDLGAVYKRLSRALSSYKEEKRGPTLLCVQSRVNTAVLCTGMPVLQDFPIVNIHISDPDLLYNTMEWQKVAAKVMLGHYLSHLPGVNIILEQSRYYRVPLGNIPQDATLFATDVFYARFLQKNNFVLWVSEIDKPDLGGREADDNRMLTEFEESTSMIVNKPGCYSSVCVSLDVDSLAVNTLLQSHQIHELEGTSGAVSFDAMPQASLEEMVEGTTLKLPSYDETALCSAAFKVLRAVVSAWLKDIARDQNVFADFQLVHFYRWLRSPHALLYDPALRRTLHNLMKKLFMQLIAELKRLGSTIVYANFHKIIICTRKRTIADAIGYVEYVVQSIRNKELFHGIDISYSQCWLYLMWLDPWNHGGIKGTLPSNIQMVGDVRQEPTSEDEEEELDEEEPEVVMCWNMMEYLPEDAGCQAQFNVLVASYISKIYQHLQSNGTVGATPRRRRGPSQAVVSQQLGVGAHEASDLEFVKDFINSELAQKMFRVAEKIHKKVPSIKVTGSDAMLSRAQDRGNVLRPALELVKAVCKVLELDPSIGDEVTRLKRNLLRLIGVGEFSKDAQWSDPCLSYVLSEVICASCNHCRDIDLCKDPHRVLNEDGSLHWQCPVCENFYSNDTIQYLLIDALNRKMMAYTLQDLQCSHCYQIKMDNMSAQCACAGKYQTLINVKDLPAALATFGNIARIFNMPLLQEVVEWVQTKQS
ncbi:hypothetical protein M8J77_017786 [Diaphorina citri]|nr:hypothetical protein M8J77_017786 [Diaphorina citri]